jgi:hypothetical protein
MRTIATGFIKARYTGPDMAPTPDRRDAAMTRAIEQAREQAEQVIVEARQRNCFFYKARVDERSLILTLTFTNGAEEKFSRSCFSTFDAQKVEFEVGDAFTIMGEIDALVLSSQDFKEYRVAKSVPKDRKPA